jgi:hypothetical protein
MQGLKMVTKMGYSNIYMYVKISIHALMYRFAVSAGFLLPDLMFILYIFIFKTFLFHGLLG